MPKTKMVSPSELFRAPRLTVAMPLLCILASVLFSSRASADEAEVIQHPIEGFQATHSTLERWSPMLDAAGLDSLVSNALDLGLSYLEMTPWELGFEKRYVVDDTFRLAIVDEILEDPLALPKWQAETVKTVRKLSNQENVLFAELGKLADAPLPADYEAPTMGSQGQSLPNHSSWDSRPTGKLPSFEAAIEQFVADLDDVTQLLEAAFAGVTPAEREEILMGAAAVMGGEDDAEDLLRKGMLHFEARSLASPPSAAAVVDTTAELSADVTLNAAARVDRSKLTWAMVAYLEASSRLSRSVLNDPKFRKTAVRRVHTKRRSDDFPENRVGGAVAGLAETRHGLVLVGGSGDNVYPREVLAEVAFVIDLGGDDTYRGRGASSVGGLFHSMGLIVDANGNDVYDARKHPFALGGALFGLAALIDLDGDDVYLADDGSLGAGYFGCGLLFDSFGRDEFSGRNFTQGAGTVGLGVLISAASEVPPPGPILNPDLAFEAGMIAAPGTGSVPIRYDESDSYSATLYGQGFAGTLGVGLLYDVEGNDLYRAGGRYPHAPLLPNDFQSLSQGFSIGMRPRAGGGVGMLIDEHGNDVYEASVYAQGTSYWYSLGFLFDGGGNDRYLATQYAQGAGVHLAIGSLWDRGGDDQYVSKNGVVQGFAHDLSVAFFVDEFGRDYYTVSDGQGISLTNSVAIFIDGHGDDLYATTGGGRGEARYRRGFSGAAIFADLEGRDTYPRGKNAENGSAWSTTNYSVGIDLDRDVSFPGEVIDEIVLTAADSVRAMEELFETASLWEVGSGREKVRRARMALKSRGMEAIDYVAGMTGPYPDGEPLAREGGLFYRTLIETARTEPDSFATRIVSRLLDNDEQVQRTAIRVLGDLKSVHACVPLQSLLEDTDEQDLWNSSIQALGKIGELGSAPIVRSFLRDASERRRLVTINSLKAIRDSASVAHFVAAMEDSEMTVRSAALSTVRSLGEHSVSELISSLGQGSDCLQRLGKIKVLGMIGAGLRDSTNQASTQTRGQIESLLWAEIIQESDSPASEAEDATTPNWPATSTAATASATRASAVHYLLRFDDEAIHDRLRTELEGEHDPLVERTYERGLEQSIERIADAGQ